MTVQKSEYYVTTWDMDKQKYTPQKGVRKGPYSLFGLRKALRKLRTMGYSADRYDAYVRVDRLPVWTESELAELRGETPNLFV